MDDPSKEKMLFMLNPFAGTGSTDWPAEIKEYFDPLHRHYELHKLDKTFNVSKVKSIIQQSRPKKVVAVGGDGTVKLLAECLLHSQIPLGVLPAGSANGMARELGIPTNPKKAIQIADLGRTVSIHLVKVNQELCIHLSDLGFNAFMVKYFENSEGRGWWGYLKATLRTLQKQPQMSVTLRTGEQSIRSTATMIVLANATQYGTGARINPVGRLDDQLFEVIVIKKISVTELYKMMISHKPYDSSKIELFQTNELSIHSDRKVHFQVDGQYFGKVHEIKAKLIPQAIKVIVP